MEFPNSPEVDRVESQIVSIEANSYKTRGEARLLVVNGQEGYWHSVKGGINRRESRPKSLENLNYEIFFDPIKNSWLKVVPVETPRQEMMTVRLQQAAHIQRTAFQVAELPHLSSTVEDVSLQDQGKIVYGFKMPHIGPSLQFFQRKIQQQESVQKMPDWAAKFFSDTYCVAFDQAVKLFLDYGYWFNDPNPGNILLHKDGRGIHVVLIDFSNRKQFSDPELKSLPQNRPDIRIMLLNKQINYLHIAFKKQCDLLGISYNDNPLANLRRAIAIRTNSYSQRVSNQATQP